MGHKKCTIVDDHCKNTIYVKTPAKSKWKKKEYRTRDVNVHPNIIRDWIIISRICFVTGYFMFFLVYDFPTARPADVVVEILTLRLRDSRRMS